MHFVSIITERELFDSPAHNVVCLAEGTDFLASHSQLLEAADLIQFRYLYANFLLEASADFRRSDLLSLDGAFEVDIGSNLFCIPFTKRLRLDDGTCAMTNFGTYAKVFDAQREDAGSMEDVWEECFVEQGLITFRLVLDE